MIDAKHRGLLWIIIFAVVIGWAVLLFLLGKLRSREKKFIIIATTFLGGLFYVLEFFFPGKLHLFSWKTVNNPFTPFLEPLGQAFMVIGGFTLLLGVINLTMVHGGNIRKLKKGWYNSLAFFVAMLAMAFFGLWDAYGKQTTPFGKTAHEIYLSLFNGALVSLDATMFSLLAFYMATAAFRAFRLRSGEATVLVLAAFLVMMGQVPMGMWFTHGLPTEGSLSGLRTENIAMWLLGIISMSGLRAVNFGVGVGALAMSLRLWLYLERGAFFEQEF
jgi:hypothetical protein